MVNINENCQFLKELDMGDNFGGTNKELGQLEQLQAIINDINLTNERS